MSVYLDGDQAKEIYIDGQEVSEIYMDGDLVYSKPSLYIGGNDHVQKRSFDLSLDWDVTPLSNVRHVAITPDRARLYARDQSGELLGLDPSNGNEDWSMTPDGNGGLGVGGQYHYAFIGYTTDGSPSYEKVDKVSQGGYSGIDAFPSPDLGTIVGSVTAAPNGDVYIGDSDGYVKGLDDYDGETLWTYDMADDDIRDIIVGPDNNYVYAVSYSTNSHVEKISTSGSSSWSNTDHTDGILGVDIDSANNYIYTSSVDSTVRKIDVPNGNQQWSTSPTSDEVTDVAVGIYDSYVYAVSVNEAFKIDASNGNVVNSTYLDIGSTYYAYSVSVG